MIVGVVCILAAGGWIFQGERVRLIVEPGYFQVHGEYTFRPTVEGAQLPILYPFPEDPSLGMPFPIEVGFVRSDGLSDPLQIHESSDGWRWTIPAGSAERVVRVRYSQSMEGDRATYVLRSTSQWNAPLENALLEVRVPTGYEAVITPKLEEVGSGPNGRFYREKFVNWMPDTDFVVTLRPEHSAR